MERIAGHLVSDVLLVRLDPEKLLLEGLREVIRAEGIRTGIVVSGIGTLSDCRIHHTIAGYPPRLSGRRVEHLELKGSDEISSIQGRIVEGEPHLHVTIADVQGSVARQWEEGCQVLTLAKVAISRTSGTQVRRVTRGPARIRQLTVAEEPSARW